MNYTLTSRILGMILLIESLFLMPSLLLSYWQKDGVTGAFGMTIGFLLLLGIFSRFVKIKDRILTPKDGLLIVSITWLICSLFGALPFFWGTSMSYVDSFFEIVSGFTTTGASVINSIEDFPKSLILWRSMTHWIGGMGILVFTISLLPKLGVGGFQIFKAESPGPIAGKIESTINDTTKRLYFIYMLITLVLFTLLKISGMSIFDAIIHTFGVVGTGGFSSYNDSLMSYGGFAVPVIMTIFMIICGTNFALFYQMYHRKWRDVLKNDEFKLFYAIIIVAIITVTIDLMIHQYDTFSMALRDSAFQVASIASTSGFANADYNQWPSFSKYILLVLMFIGSSAGSTAGGMKVIRIVVLLKLIQREMKRAVHPKAVLPIRLNGKSLSEEVVLGISAYLGIYILIFMFSTGLVTLSGQDLVTSLTSVATMLSNVGPGFANVGPTQNFFFYSDFYKIYFALLMLLGRLEFFTILAIIAPRTGRQ